MERKRINSSKIRSAGYDPKSQTLELEFSDGRVERLLFLSEILGPLRFAPHRGIGEELLYGFEALLLAFEVKDTSAARSTGNRGRRASRRSG